MADACRLCGHDPAVIGFLDVGTGPVCLVCLARLPEMLKACAGTAAALEMATTDELVAELLRRETFRGLILRQQESFKGPCLPEWRWDVKNCNAVEVMRQMLAQLDEAGT